ncbi:hypothetical protein KIN20_014050 [Parelaphostrongylus tenuis]|uniref:S phase cyclin A-associated protein in the endoplasmic reticulum N-terminal domain-containing protein n=1 Tax=Parelaphostrongylus tenuis TaxID=148309 RepID=A0AAD5QP01_PARTN|nr:hypothetical protein KIN20_014050 [Parelaphostrongylus tenuis]
MRHTYGPSSDGQWFDSALMVRQVFLHSGNGRKRGQQWAFYMESFKKSIDYLYEICRSDHNISACKEAIMYLENSKRDFESLINTINVETSWDESSKPQAVAWEIRKSSHTPVQVTSASVSVQHNGSDTRCEEDEECKEPAQQDGWQLVLPRRRRSTSSSSEAAASHNLTATTLQQQQAIESEPTRQSVYDRLSAPRRTNSPSVSNVMAMSRCNTSRSSVSLQQARLTCPRSAMDLPQTKASMAKMAYSRQLLWERNQSLLAEKLRAKQRMERIDQYKRRAGPTRCGIHFASHPVSQNNGSLRERLQCASAPASESNPSVDRSLQSINEVGEGDEVETVPADPTPTHDSSNDNVRFSSTRSEPAFGEVSSLLGLDDDAEWREMTEEEESLALEEQSLNLEIEHEESFSIDIELERQVAAEAEALEKFELSKNAAFTACQEKDVHRNESTDVDGAHQGGGCGGKNCGRVARTWSEVVGKDLVTAYREPGTVAERHEKMSSPSRRRCDKNDADFSSRHAEKLRRASELRAQLQAEKTARLRELTRRVLEVQFINSLQGGNMVLDLRMRDAGVEERKQTIAEERARRIEEKAAKEHAAEERRKFAELERMARLQEIAEKKEARHAQLTAQRNEQERLRSEKRKQQQEKITELRMADAEENESLRKRIQEKIELSSRRHEQTLEDVRVRAQELSSPRPPSSCRRSWSFVDPNHWPSDVTGNNFKCSACSCELPTELEAVAHVMSRAHLSITSPEQICVTTDDLEREFSSLTQSPASLDGDSAENDLLWRKKRMKVKQRLAARNKKIASVEQTPQSLITFQAKSLSELANLISKLQPKQSRLEDSALQSLERVLGDAHREADSQGWTSSNSAQSFLHTSLLVDLLSYVNEMD